MHDVRSALRLTILTAVTTIAFVSCGFPQYLYLAPPVFQSLNSTVATFVFSHAIDNNIDSFLGYEIYYKFYDPTKPESESWFIADAAAIEASAPGNTVVMMESRGYRRVDPTDQGLIKPLLPIAPADKSSAFDVTVSFPNKVYTSDDNPPASADWLTNTVLLLRDQSFAVPYGDERFFSIDINAAPPDPDVPEGLPLSPGQVDMAIVVFSYGIDYESGTFGQIYSSPLMITSVTNLIPINYQ